MLNGGTEKRRQSMNNGGWDKWKLAWNNGAKDRQIASLQAGMYHSRDYECIK